MNTSNGVETYNQLKTILRQSSQETLFKELRQAEAELPVLCAAFQMLSLVLYQEIEQLDTKRLAGNTASIINAIEPIVIRTAMNLPLWRGLVLDPQRLCEILNQWAAHVYFSELCRSGIAPDPVDYCAKR